MLATSLDLWCNCSYEVAELSIFPSAEAGSRCCHLISMALLDVFVRRVQRCLVASYEDILSL